MTAIQPIMLRAPTDATLRLFAFPHAGGSQASFRDWPSFLQDEVELISYQLPDRGTNQPTAPYQRMPPLVEDLADVVIAADDGTPFVFFGHSFGALVAHMVCETLDVRGATPPKRLILSAHRAPHLPPQREEGDRLKYELPDSEFLEVVKGWGMIPEEVLADRDFLELVLPPLRADLEVDETCVAAPGPPSLVPCTLFHGTDDKTVSEEELAGWSAHYGDISIEGFSGGHFYTVECEDMFAAALNRALDCTRAACPRAIMSAAPARPIGEQTLWDRFAGQVAACPSGDALIDGSRRWTFAELHDSALSLARRLEERNVTKGDAIGLFLPHCAEYSIGVLASTFLGAPTCLLEKGWSDAVLHMFLDSVGPKVILTTPELYRRLPPNLQDSDAVILVGEAASQDPVAPSRSCPAPVTGQDIAMISMTSGSTGKPKAVLTTHQGCLNCFDARFERYPYRRDSREGLNVFFAWECLRPLLQGVPSVIIPDGRIFDATQLVETLESERITRVTVTTSLLESVLDHPVVGPTLKDRLAHMEMWLLMGEVVSGRVIEKARQRLPNGVGLVNAYSTWESLDISFADLLTPDDRPAPATAPVGYLIDGSTAMMLDVNRHPVPYGAMGELYFASLGIAPGYFGDDVKTTQNFVRFDADERASGIPDLVYYRTGDRAKFLPDGQIQVLGRMDDTIKLRGFKVSLSATERVLENEKGVARAIIRPIVDGETRQPTHTVAYIHGDDGLPSETTLARVRLRAESDLPEYARPRHVIGLERIPLRDGESRKLDLNKLPPPPVEAEPVALAHAALSAMEAKVASAWKAVLGVKHAASHDNFFSLGGDSLTAARLTGFLAHEYGVSLSVLDIFQYPTLAQMASTLRSSGNVSPEPSRPARRPTSESTKLAVVGMAGRFPSADSIFSFWQNLKNGTDSLSTFDRVALERKGVSPEVLDDPNWVPAGQKIDDADKFDAGFWSISRREAEIMDPQHRVFIEIAAKALEQAGYARSNNPYRHRTGVFAACGIDGYLIHHLEGGGLKTPLDPSGLFLTEIGNEKDYIATRVSYLLDLGGPSVAVTSACSSALVTVALAGESILSGQCDMAIAGGSSITFPNFGYCYETGLVGSEDGHVRPFDQAASGTLFGDSVGAVVLKRLDDAVADGDHIWAVMSGFGLSNDGIVKAGYTAPSAQAQARCISDAIEMAGVKSDTISYVECHATATLVGDAIEIKGLKDAFDAHRSDETPEPGSCRIGSVKGNIGHANCAAGITGFIKTALSLHHRSLPKTVNFDTLNPKLVGLVDCDGSPFSIQTELEPWDVVDPDRQLPRRAGVSSFGIGGTNAHVILEEAPEIPVDTVTQDEPSLHLVTISGKSPEALARNCTCVAKAFADLEPAAIAPAVRTLNIRREHHPVRAAAVITSDPADAARQIAALADARSERTSGHPATVAFCFSGQGSQHPSMARALYTGLSDGGRFRSRFDEVCRHLAAHLSDDPAALLLDADEMSVKRPLVTQCGLFAVEYTLAASLMDIGLRPVAVAGHSIGEYAAAAISGLISLPDAARLVAHRALASEAMLAEQADNGRTGGMLSVAGDIEQLTDWLEGCANLWLAVENTPDQVVVAGLLSDLAEAEAKLTDLGFRCRTVPVSHPFHSPLMQPVADRVDQVAAGLVSATPDIPLASNVTGTWFGSGGASPDYWSKHIISRVLWRSDVDKLLQWEPDIVLEIGPGHVLTNLVGKCLRAHPDLRRPVLFPSMPELAHDAVANETQLLETLGALWTHGTSFNWERFHGRDEAPSDTPPTYAVLPTYAFEPTSIWVRPEKSIYVGTETTAEQMSYAIDPAVTKCLVRHVSKPAGRMKLYCFPFAGGAASAFKYWSKNAPDWIDVVAVEYPGRGTRMGDTFPGDAASDDRFLEEIAASIRVDAGRGRVAFCGVSLGVTIAMALLNGPLEDLARSEQIVGLSLVGRAPFGSTDDHDEHVDVQEFLLASKEARSDRRWQEGILPLLQQDLDLDTRLAANLADNLPTVPILSAPLQIHCGDADPSFQTQDIKGWRRWSSHVLFDTQTYAGDHGFIVEAERQILERTIIFFDHVDWATDLSLRSAIDPVHQVHWSPVRRPDIDQIRPLHIVRLSADLAESVSVTNDILASDDASIALLCDSVDLSSLDLHVDWLLNYLQQLVTSGTTGNLLLALPANAAGGALAGLTSTLAQEGAGLAIRRLFVGGNDLWSASSFDEILRNALGLEDECDLLARNGCYFAQRLTRPDLPDLKPGTLGPLPGTYIVTGATGGLGATVIDWLVEGQGVPPDRIVAMSRRGGGGGVEGIRHIATGPGGHFDLDAALDDDERLAGIFHIAGTIDDGLFADQTVERVRAVMSPKRALTDLVAMGRERAAPWIVAFSSTTSLLGAAGQSNYAAANAFMDAAASWNSPIGGPAVASIHWGSWSGVGMSARSLNALQAARKSGEYPLAPKKALEGLGKIIALLLSGSVSGGRFAICDITWAESPWQGLPLISALSSVAPSVPALDPTPEVSDEAKTKAEPDAPNPVRAFLDSYVHNWDEFRDLQGLGLDSLDFARMRGDFSKTFGKDVPLTLIAQPNQTLGDLYNALCAI